MADHTAISWAEATWSPVSGCTRVSPGCDHCYIERTPPFRKAHRRFDGNGPGSTTGVMLHPERLEIPLHWRKPRRVFVCSMADLFHDEVPDEYIARVWAIMVLSPQHTFQVLTKRPARMRSLLTSREWREGVQNHIAWYENPAEESLMTWARWPLRNVWLGCTAENQQWADIRVPALLDTPAAVRWVSAEPLLGPLDLSRWTTKSGAMRSYRGHFTMCNGAGGSCFTPWCSCPCHELPFDLLNWVVTGGESGPGARPAHPDWFRAIRDQCQAAGAAFHHKQNGEWVPESWCLHGNNAPAAFLSIDGHVRHLVNGKPTEPPMSRGQDITIRRCGKPRAGRELDGRVWDEYPEAVNHA